MLLFSVGVIALLRVLGVSVRDAGDLEYRATAAAIADQTVGRMWVDRGNLGAYAETDAVLAGLPNGFRTVTVNGNVVTVTINWQPPGADAARTHSVSATLASN